MCVSIQFSRLTAVPLEVPGAAVVGRVAALVVGAVALGGRQVARGGALALVLVARDAGRARLLVVVRQHGLGRGRAQLGEHHVV